MPQEDPAVSEAKRLWSEKRPKEAMQVLVRRIQESPERARHNRVLGAFLIGLVLGVALCAVLYFAVPALTDGDDDGADHEAADVAGDTAGVSSAALNGPAAANPTTVPTTAPAAQPSGRWEIIPLEIHESAGDGGWKEVWIQVGFENGTGTFANPDSDFANAITGCRDSPHGLSECKLVTEEGYSYPADYLESKERVTTYNDGREEYDQHTYFPAGQEGLMSASVVGDDIPPGARFKAWYYLVASRSEVEEGHVFYLFSSTIAETTHLDSLYIPDYGYVSLQDIGPVDFSLHYYGTLGSVGDSYVFDDVQVTIRDFQMDDDEGRRVLMVPVHIENLNSGYEATVDLRWAAMGSNGILGDHYVQNHASCSYVESLGPSQSTDLTLCVELPEGSENVFFFLTPINAVFDTGF